MNQQQAESVKHLAKPCVEALEIVTERECPECKGKGAVVVIGAILHCDTCDSGREKVRWKWKPEVGEWCILYGDVLLITRVSLEKVLFDYGLYGITKYIKDCIPILPWETIERVLEEAGYEVFMARYRHPVFAKCRIYKNDKELLMEQRKTRQEAVMKAVIALGKERKQ